MVLAAQIPLERSSFRIADKKQIFSAKKDSRYFKANEDPWTDDMELT